MGSSAVELVHARELIRSRAREIRERSGLTCGDVARSLGCHPSAVPRWEDGRRVPRPNLAKEYADLLRQLEEEASCHTNA